MLAQDYDPEDAANIEQITSMLLTGLNSIHQVLPSEAETIERAKRVATIMGKLYKYIPTIIALLALASKAAAILFPKDNKNSDTPSGKLIRPKKTSEDGKGDKSGGAGAGGGGDTASNGVDGVADAVDAGGDGDKAGGANGSGDGGKAGDPDGSGDGGKAGDTGDGGDGKRKRGGQKGHKGTSLSHFPNPNKIVTILVDTSTLPPGDWVQGRPITRQIVEIKFDLIITQFVSEVLVNKATGEVVEGPVPEEYRKDGELFEVDASVAENGGEGIDDKAIRVTVEVPGVLRQDEPQGEEAPAASAAESSETVEPSGGSSAEEAAEAPAA